MAGDQINQSIMDFMMNKSGSNGGGGGGGGGPAPDDKDHAKVAIDIGVELFKTGVKMVLPVNLETPEDGVGSGLSLTKAAPLKAGGNIPSVVNSLQGGDGFIRRTLAALIKDGSIKSLADGVEASDAVHRGESPSISGAMDANFSNIEAPVIGAAAPINTGGHGHDF